MRPKPFKSQKLLCMCKLFCMILFRLRSTFSTNKVKSQYPFCNLSGLLNLRPFELLAEYSGCVLALCMETGDALNAMYGQVHDSIERLFWAGNQGNHQNFNPSLLPKNL